MKILIADPHPEVQAALCLIAGRIPEVTEVTAAGSLLQLLAQCAGSCPNLIMLDLALVKPAYARTRSLADLIRVLQCLCPNSRVVVISSQFEAAQEVLQVGASGVIRKTDPPDEVLASIADFLKNCLPNDR